jgi:hypothetical protein
MEYTIIGNVALATGNYLLQSVDDVLDLIATVDYQTNCNKVIVKSKHLSSNFSI